MGNDYTRGHFVYKRNLCAPAMLSGMFTPAPLVYATLTSPMPENRQSGELAWRLQG
ncbi:hypothetical protein ACVOMT_06460 [Sphingomonas panni]